MTVESVRSGVSVPKILGAVSEGVEVVIIALVVQLVIKIRMVSAEIVLLFCIVFSNLYSEFRISIHRSSFIFPTPPYLG